MAHFIKTSDEETAQKLLSQGFQLISKDSGIWTFINNASEILFERKDKIVESDMLEF